ncbi:MAG: hypothetical protein ACRD2S_02195 [Terriglobales bacterium]
MKVGAIVTVPGSVQQENVQSGGRAPAPYLFQAFGGHPLACYEVLGETLLQRTLNALSDSGIEQQTVLTEQPASERLFPSRVPSAGRFFSAWEEAVGQHLDQGAEILAFIRLGAYLEIDFAELLEFHRQASGVLTQVYDHKSAFDLAIVTTSQLRGDTGSYRGRLSSLIPYHRRYQFTGYANRLREPQDLRQLAHDGLFGRNSIRPCGEEVTPGVWIGEGASIDSSACITGPAYIGARSRVRGSCLINGVTTIERDCEVDFGTTVTDSSVLPETYLGIGLNFSHSIVAANGLFHLDRNVAVEISDRNLVAKRRSIGTLKKSIGRKSFFDWGEPQLNGADTHL